MFLPDDFNLTSLVNCSPIIIIIIIIIIISNKIKNWELVDSTTALPQSNPRLLFLTALAQRLSPFHSNLFLSKSPWRKWENTSLSPRHSRLSRTAPDVCPPPSTPGVGTPQPTLRDLWVTCLGGFPPPPPYISSIAPAESYPSAAATCWDL